MGVFSKMSRAVDTKIIEVQSGVVAEKAKNQKGINRMKTMITTALCLTAIFTTMAFAAGDMGEFKTVGEKISNGMANIFNLIRAVALPVGIVSLVACGIAYFFGGEKGMEAGKKWAMRIAVGLAIVGLAPVLINAVYSVFKSDASTDIFFGGVS